MKWQVIFAVIVLSIFFLSTNYKGTKTTTLNSMVDSRWTGTVTYEEVITYTNPVYSGQSERHITSSFISVLPTMYRDNPENYELDFIDDKGPGSHTFHSEITYIDGTKCITSCQSSDKAELHAVVIDEEPGTYDIEVVSPTCIGTGCAEDGSSIPYEESQSVIVSNHPLLGNKDQLSGTESVSEELIGDMGTYTRTTTWHLERTKEDDVELIVTPEDYNNWLPTPGMNELAKGSVININLILQGKNGKPLKVKAESFELRLNTTSREPGITINYPVSPSANQLPDLRFLPYNVPESIDEDQFISITCNDGKSGQVTIASYDGGGFATLSAEAILEDNRHIKGHLLVSGGDVDILIPKRTPGNKIALAWAKVNGSPLDLDDKETSKKNGNNGDGLTAYEEYRGVISEGKFKRLDPQKKELGILVKQSEIGLFTEGFSTFTNASGINIMLFDKNEIPDNRRINQNAKTAHNFKQYALRIAKGNTSETDIYGFVMNVYGVAYPKVDIPARVTHITINVDRIRANFLRDLAIVRNLPYTEKDMIASTVAHEIGHGVNVDHHGEDLPYINTLTVVSTDTIIYRYPVQTVHNRPYTINGPIGLYGNQQCGDVNCVMCYVNRSFWVKLENNITSIVLFSSIPILPYGKIFCNDKKGTGVNDLGLNYGDAIKGNCLGQIKMRD